MINDVFLLGRIGQQPEFKTLENGSTLCKLSLATSEAYKNKAGEKVEETTWHNVVVWGKQAEVVEKYVSKGDLLHIKGKIKTRSWEHEGTKRYVTEVVVEPFGGKVTLMPKQKTTEARTTEAKVSSKETYGPYGDAQVVEEEEGQDLPF
jgi:single-strand DNA-binding protein